MDHGTGVTVAIDHEVVNNEIPQHLIDIYHAFDIISFAESLQRFNQSVPIRFGDVSLGLIKNIGIAVWIIVDILQLHIVAAHASAHAGVASFHATAPVHIRRCKSIRHLREIFFRRKFAFKWHLSHLGHKAVFKNRCVLWYSRIFVALL